MDIRIMVEIRAPGEEERDPATVAGRLLESAGFMMDPNFEPVPMGGQTGGGTSGPSSYIVCGFVSREADLLVLESQPEVISIWRDTRIEPFEE